MPIADTPTPDSVALIVAEMRAEIKRVDHGMNQGLPPEMEPCVAHYDVRQWADRLASLPTPGVPVERVREKTLAFTDATIDKLQDVMAVHGFVVPVRVISDAFITTWLAQEGT